LTAFSLQRWVVAAVLMCLAAARAAAGGEPDLIFKRFSTGREVPKTWQTMVELPMVAVPQTTPEARIVANEGVNLVIAYRPENRAYFSRSFGYARLEWAPENEVKTAQVVTLDVTEILNFRLTRGLVMSIGLGLGLMHGVIASRDGFQARFEPFIPLQLGFTVPIGGNFTLGVKAIQSSFFGPGPSLSVLRGVVGIGYNY
jgi:hypothetical protein